MTMFTHSQANLFEDASMFSPADSPVNPSAKPESGSGSTTSGICSQKCYALSEKFSPLGSFLRTLMASPRWHSKYGTLKWEAQNIPVLRRSTITKRYTHERKLCFSTVSVKQSKKKDTPSNRLLFLLSHRKRTTKGSGSGSLREETLPTPHGFSQDGKSNGPSGNELGFAVNQAHREMLGTPTSTNRERSPETLQKCAEFRKRNANQNTVPLYLGEQIKMLRTPQASDGEKGGPNQRDSSGHPHLSMQVAMLPTPTTQEVEHPSPDLTPSGRRLAKNGNSHSLNLADTVQMLPTPDANLGARGEMKEWVPVRPSGHHACLTLNDAIRIKTGMLNTPSQMMPTPNAADGKTGYMGENRNGKQENVETVLRNQTGGSQTGMKLQPNFVEFLMSFPINWTSLDCPTEEITE